MLIHEFLWPLMDFNKNDKQIYFNQIKGTLCELNNHDRYCSITVTCGHESERKVNLNISKAKFDAIAKVYRIGDRVAIKFYANSRFKDERWYTALNVLEINRD